MALITISRGSYCKGREVAEKVAERLGYECISRDLLIETSKEYDIPELKLVRAIHDAPTLLDRIRGGRQKYMGYIRTSLLQHFQRDNMVYHGLAGHFLVDDVAHVLKVRIIADIDDRVNLEMEREHISKNEALRLIKHDDEERRKWSCSVCGIDTSDSSLYDLLVHIKKYSVDDAVDLICYSIESGKFNTTPESQRVIDELLIVSTVKMALVESHPHCEVTINRGLVTVTVDNGDPLELMRTVEAIPGVQSAHVKIRELTRN